MPGGAPRSERRSPIRRLKSVDLPTLGRPTMATRGRDCFWEIFKPLRHDSFCTLAKSHYVRSILIILREGVLCGMNGPGSDWMRDGMSSRGSTSLMHKYR